MKATKIKITTRPSSTDLVGRDSGLTQEQIEDINLAYVAQCVKVLRKKFHTLTVEVEYAPRDPFKSPSILRVLDFKTSDELNPDYWKTLDAQHDFTDIQEAIRVNVDTYNIIAEHSPRTATIFYKRKQSEEEEQS